ncbi:MAG: hypothetical protein K2J58_03145 [Muribaculaceae bacterium]|nr:hypothetical protein [Muribaculaceae bacterium]
MKKIGLFCAAVAASLSMSAQDTTPLTIEMWHQWDGFGADAQIVETTKELVSNLGKTDNFVMGNPACDGDCYADLTEYAGIEGKGTSSNGVVRFYFNRQELQGNGIDHVVDIAEDGTFKFDFSDLQGKPAFIHLNFVKFHWGQEGDIEYINLIPKNGDEPVVPVDPYAITGAWFHEWDGYGADATITNENPVVDDLIGKEVGGGTTVLGTGSVWGEIYADLTDYAGIEAEGTPGATIRLLFNRPSHDAGITEFYVTFDDEGKFNFQFTEVKDGNEQAAFIHLNAVKINWGLPEGMSSCKITKFNAIPKVTTSVNAIENVESSVIYNIYGQRVDESYRGIVIKNGKKYINK